MAPPSTSSGGRPFRFVAIGDYGTGGVEQLSVAARMCRWRRRHDFDFVVTTGDNIYPNADPARFDSQFFAPYACLLDDGVEWHATLGNHDWGYEEGAAVVTEPSFGMDGHDYVVRRRGVRFVMVNSNDLDRAWLERHLDPPAEDRWTIVAFHHPVFSPGLHGSTPGFEDLHDLFLRNGVDLVLNGHDHIYAVTKATDGLRYVVTGGGGAPLYPCLPSALADVCEERHHFLFVQAGGERISAWAVPVEGPPFDSFTTRGIDPPG